MGEDYTSASRGTLKLKGVQGGRVEKPKRKKKRRKEGGDGGSGAGSGAEKGEAEVSKDTAAAQPSNEQRVEEAGVETAPKRSEGGAERGRDGEEEQPEEVAKTEAQLRHEQHRRRLLDERLKREGVKTHKERVEELNRYLSGLSEHHDMPRIGPG